MRAECAMQEFLNDPKDKKAFFHCSRHVRFEESVLAKYPSNLSLCLPILSGTEVEYIPSQFLNANPEIEFPRCAARLRM